MWARSIRTAPRYFLWGEEKGERWWLGGRGEGADAARADGACSHRLKAAMSKVAFSIVAESSAL